MQHWPTRAKLLRQDFSLTRLSSPTAMSRALSPTSPTFGSRPTMKTRTVAPRPSRPSQPASLHQRILYPSPTGPRPPKILHSPAHTTLDPLILDLLALICREHVLSWYSSISRDPDRAFIQQVTSVLVHVIQALEVRFAHVDFVGLLVLDLPSLLDRHVTDWDQATEKANTGHAHNFDRDNVFHLLQPHIAISLHQSIPGGALEPKVDKTYLRALVDNLLRLLLPPEDYRAETERLIVREIIVNIIFGNVYTRVAQPWFMHSAIAKVLESRHGGNQVGETSTQDSAAPLSPTATPLITLVDRAFSTLHSAVVVLRAVFASLAALYHTAIASPVPLHYKSHPPLTAPLLSFLVALLPPSPLVAQFVHYLSLPLAFFSSFVTSVIFYLVNDRIFTADLVKVVLQGATQALFPNGHSPPKEADQNEDEQREWKRRCEEAVAKAIPCESLSCWFSSLELTSVTARAPSLFYPSHVIDADLALARHLLRPLSSHVANVHLLVLVVDLVVGKLFPELTPPKIELATKGVDSL